MNPFDLLPLFYTIVTGIALAGWLAIIIFPRQPWANFWFGGVFAPLALCLIYVYLMLTYWFLEPRGTFSDFYTLDGVYRMFSNSGLLLVAWINVFAMNLVVGSWMTRKAVQTQMPLYRLYPCLLLTFIFAGIGFTVFSVVASIGGRWRQISDVEQVPPVDSQPVIAIPGILETAK